MLSYSFKQNLRGTLLMFEKGGVAKQKKYEGLEKISLNIPASNYFQIFTDSSKIKNYILVSALFESILDLKEIFKAVKVNLRIKDNQLIIFLQNGKLSYQQSSAWHSVASEKDFEKTSRHFIEVDEKLKSQIDSKAKILSETHICPTCYSTIDENTVKAIKENLYNA